MQNMRDIVAKCLVKDPARRPTAAQLLEHKFFKVCVLSKLKSFSLEKEEKEGKSIVDHARMLGRDQSMRLSLAAAAPLGNFSEMTTSRLGIVECHDNHVSLWQPACLDCRRLIA